MSDLAADIDRKGMLRPAAIFDNPERTIRNTPCHDTADVKAVPLVALEPPSGFRPDEPLMVRIGLWAERVCASPLTHTAGHAKMDA